MNQNEKILELMNELLKMGINIRGDYTNFDGKDLLRAIEIWLQKLGRVTNVKAPFYFPENYKVQKYRRNHCFNTDVSECFP